MKRILTALALIPLIVWVVLYAPQWAFLVVLAAVGLIAFHEFSRIAKENGIPEPGWPGMIAGLALLLAPQPQIVVVLIACLGMLVALRVRDLAESLPAAAAFTLGVVYIFGAWRCAIYLRAIDANWLMFALLLSWAGDTAALYVGKAFGRHALAPRVSPAKTWEGAVGSVAGGIVAGVAYAHYLIPSAPLAQVIGFAAAGNIAGQIGDLCESAMKRGAGVKDSGTTLPGHGGWLDRIDSSLFSVPVVYALLKWVAA
ncbi:MAG TPA: phosphatidate cytidylyltransferase [Bryobacteraceae bacterium]|jgi:phosphatidate cytidylyltransferase|nr:phosphatidate cytidylyltransferase [Bryobacteraceae bacterium]